MYIMYGLYYLRNRVKYKMNHDEAYENNPFELEAYSHENDIDYLKNRVKFNWRIYGKENC